MRFPKMRPRQALELKILDLAGGLNLRDGLSEVLDNQLTECKNMWYQDGILKTRPGFKTTAENVLYTGTSAGRAEIRYFSEIKRNIGNNNTDLGVLRVGKTVKTIKTGMFRFTFYFAWQSATTTKMLPSFYLDSRQNDETCFVVEKNNVLYCFVSNRTIRKYTEGSHYWDEVSDEERYCPLVLTDCVASDCGTQTAADVMSSGVMVESYNLLGKSYKVQYTAFNPNIAWQETENETTFSTHYMRYHLPEDANSLRGKTVSVAYTSGAGVAEHKITFSTSDKVVYEIDLNDTDGLRLCAQGNSIWFNKNTDNLAEIYKIKDSESGYRNNIEVIMPFVATNQEVDKIFKMTQCSWFGGAASGLAGGTRLFLCGNKDNEKSLVCYSGLDNPLYFPENSYFYVGDTTTAVTGFGKQSDKLIVFKENETWYTYYQQNNNIDAQDLINQSVVDYASSSVLFPLCQINANIGCKYPETIQLCRNRLVWLGEDGNVYTLVSDNQYNERSIFCVSEMVKKSIKKEIMSSAVACDWNGYYCLLIGKNLYLMDYNSYGYTHIASYSKTEDANVRIPWYIWQLPESVPYLPSLCALNDKMFLTYYHDGIIANRCSLVGNVLSADNEPVDLICYEDDNKEDLLFKENLIESKMTTKLFDFGQPSVRKNVDKINLQLGNNGGETINVKVITECGQESHEIVLTGTQTQSYTPEFIDSKAIFPCIRQVCKIGLELSSTGVIAIDGMNFKYKTSGGAR